jgi:hypothetical protein
MAVAPFAITDQDSEPKAPHRRYMPFMGMRANPVPNVAKLCKERAWVAVRPYGAHSASPEGGVSHQATGIHPHAQTTVFRKSDLISIPPLSKEPCPLVDNIINNNTNHYQTCSYETNHNVADLSTHSHKHSLADC